LLCVIVYKNYLIVVTTVQNILVTSMSHVYNHTISGYILFSFKQSNYGLYAFIYYRNHESDKNSSIILWNKYYNVTIGQWHHFIRIKKSSNYEDNKVFVQLFHILRMKLISILKTIMLIIVIITWLLITGTLQEGISLSPILFYSIYESSQHIFFFMINRISTVHTFKFTAY
jgi:hypothetical protein